MGIANRYAYRYLFAVLMLTGCALPKAPQVDNPVADALRAQARELNRQAQACQEDAAEYRAQKRAPIACGDSGFVEVGLSNSQIVSECVIAILMAVPACRSWADSYKANVAADAGKGGASEEVSLMEAEVIERGH
jgi:hypothetical protein